MPITRVPDGDVGNINIEEWRIFFNAVDFDYRLSNGADDQGSGVHIGAGIVLTAGHVVSSNLGAPLSNRFTITIREGVAGGESTAAFGSGPNSGIYHIGNYAGEPAIPPALARPNGFGAGGHDIAVAQTSISTIVTAPMLIFSDPNDAAGNIITAGYPFFNGVSSMNGENMYVSSGTLSAGSYVTLSPSGYNVWRTDTTVVNGVQPFISVPGQSGSGVYLRSDPDGDGFFFNYLIGVMSQASVDSNGFPTIQNPTTGASVEPISDSYVALAAQLFDTVAQGGLFLDPLDFATNTIMADQDGLQTPITQGTGFNEIFYGRDTGPNDVFNMGTGWDTVMASLGSDTINGGVNSIIVNGFSFLLGNDTVDYTGLAANITVTATVNASNIMVAKSGGNGTDTLTGIESIFGTAQADAFIINSLQQGVPVIINGQSNVFDPNGNPQELPDTKNTTVSEVLTLPTSGGRALSSAQAMDAYVAASGLNFMIDGTEDTMTLAQALWDAGAQVTYYSAFGEGVIYLNGVQIGYTGVHFEPTQTDFFAGIPVGGTVGLTDTGSTTLDLSGVVGNITSTVLAGISLWNLVDEIAVGAGDVTLDLGAFGVSEFTGGDGVDDITGGVLDDIFSGNAGDDILDGGAGDDVLDGGLGADTLMGGAGDDLLFGGAGADVLNGGAGTDTVSYADAASGVRLNLVTGGTLGEAQGDTYVGIERVIGSDFADVITGSAGNDEILSGGGNDILWVSGGADVFDGGAGTDQVSYRNSGTSIILDLNNLANSTGTAAGDSYTGVERFGGSNLGDTMYANDAGGQTLYGNGGNDNLQGGAGIDILVGGSGNDTVNGGAGNDRLFGNTGNDLIIGGDGDDHLSGSTGADDLRGQNGNDKLIGGAGADTLDGGLGNDVLSAGADNDFLTGRGGNDRLNGEGGNDTLYGGSGHDVLNGQTGNDIMYGGTGNDRFSGSSGDDVMYGEAGADKLYGGAGTDTDTVFDFTVNADVFEIGGGISYGDLSFSASANGKHTTISYNGHNIFVKNTTVAELDAAQFVFTSGSAAEKAVVSDDIGVVEKAVVSEDGFVFVEKPVVSDVDISVEGDDFALPQDALAAFLANSGYQWDTYINAEGILEIGSDVFSDGNDLFHGADIYNFA